MHYTTILVIIAMLLIWGPWLLRTKIIPYFVRLSNDNWLKTAKDNRRIKQCLNLLEVLYKKDNPFMVSRFARAKQKIHDDAFVYGEVLPLTMVRLLQYTHPQKHEIFCDLGSGAGKAVLVAGMCFDFKKAKGIEVLPLLHNLAQKRLTEFHQHCQLKKIPMACHVQFQLADYLDVDLQDVDVIFMNATCYQGELWDSMVTKFRGLKVGARIILTTKRLNYPEFKLLYQGQELMSWGLNSSFVYEKVR